MIKVDDIVKISGLVVSGPFFWIKMLAEVKMVTKGIMPRLTSKLDRVMVFRDIRLAMIRLMTM